MTNLFKENEEIGLTLRKCAALTLLKPEDVDLGWIHIQSHAPIKVKITKFLDFFVDQWLQNSSIPLEMGNCFNVHHRTNNVVEGWNHKINRKLGRP